MVHMNHSISWGNIGIMENEMETIMMENQMEKKMENEMETRSYSLNSLNGVI